MNVLDEIRLADVYAVHVSGLNEILFMVFDFNPFTKKMKIIIIQIYSEYRDELNM